jgi:hypothetical protein
MCQHIRGAVQMRFTDLYELITLKTTILRHFHFDSHRKEDK